MSRKIVSPSQHRATAVGVALVAIWAAWDDERSDELDTAMASLVRESVAIDYAHVDRRLKLALRYFADAYLNDINPLDWTYCQMIEAIEVAVKTAEGFELDRS